MFSECVKHHKVCRNIVRQIMFGINYGQENSNVNALFILHRKLQMSKASYLFSWRTFDNIRTLCTLYVSNKPPCCYNALCNSDLCLGADENQTGCREEELKARRRDYHPKRSATHILLLLLSNSQQDQSCCLYTRLCPDWSYSEWSGGCRGDLTWRTEANGGPSARTQRLMSDTKRLVDKQNTRWVLSISRTSFSPWMINW